MKIFETPIGMIRKNIRPIGAIVVIMIALICSSLALAAQNQESDLAQVTTERPTAMVTTTSSAKMVEPITVQPPTTNPPTTVPPTTVPPTTVPPTTVPPTTQAEEPDVYWEAEEMEIHKEDGREYFGMFTLTAYCPCYECSEGNGNKNCRGGTCVEGRTVACNVIPYGTRIYIEGYGEFVVEDVGGGLGSSKIDLYFNDHRDNFMDYREVYIIN